jgi:lathosterol oxidase
MLTILSKYLIAFAVLGTRYLVIAGGYYLLTWKALKRFIWRFVVNPAEPFEGQIRFELKYGALTTLIFSFSSIHFSLAEEYELGFVYENISDYGWSYWWFSVFLMLILHDLYFYWTHRLLHKKIFFSRFHNVHHRSRVTTPLTSQSFHGFETVVNTFIAIAFPYILPLHPTAYLAFHIIAFLNNVYGHSNYDWIQAPLRNYAPFSLLNSPSVHGLHHQKAHGNYGLYTTIWDRLHGTYINPHDIEIRDLGDYRPCPERAF